MAESVYPAELEGWLTKQGHVVKNWKRRWFVLSSQRSPDYASHGFHRLFYFTGNPRVEYGRVELKGIIPLRGASITAVLNTGKPFSFLISGTVDRKDFYIHADGQDDYRRWMDVLNAAASPQGVAMPITVPTLAPPATLVPGMAASPAPLVQPPPPPPPLPPPPAVAAPPPLAAPASVYGFAPAPPALAVFNQPSAVPAYGKNVFAPPPPPDVVDADSDLFQPPAAYNPAMTVAAVTATAAVYPPPQPSAPDHFDLVAYPSGPSGMSTAPMFPPP